MQHDDLGRRRIECPLLALWSAAGALPRFYGDPLEVWRPWADDLSGYGIPASHFLVEEQPEMVADALTQLVQRTGSASQPDSTTTRRA